MGRYLVETIVLLVVMCALAVVVLFVARRAGLGAARGPIRLVGQLPLDPRRSVYLVQVASKVLVVGVSEGGMTKLGELEQGELPIAPAPPSTAFRDVFARILGNPPPAEPPASPSQPPVPGGKGAEPPASSSQPPLPGGQGAEPPASPSQPPVPGGKGAEPPHSVRAGRATRENPDGS